MELGVAALAATECLASLVSVQFLSLSSAVLEGCLLACIWKSVLSNMPGMIQRKLFSVGEAKMTCSLLSTALHLLIKYLTLKF